MKFFIAEDDESIRGLTLYALENAGFEVEGFETAAEFRARVPTPSGPRWIAPRRSGGSFPPMSPMNSKHR